MVDFAFARGLEAGEAAQRAGLAAAGGPEQRVELPFLDLQIDPADGVNLPGVALVMNVQARNADHLASWICAPRPNPNCRTTRLMARSASISSVPMAPAASTEP